MADVRAFRGVRYGDAVAAEIGRLIAPPYDVTFPALVAQLRARSPYNMVHLEHVEPDPGHDPHTAAASRYRAWLGRGILTRDDAPALYHYDHFFSVDGRRLRHRGFFAAVQLAAWDERVVLPHEETFPAPKLERLQRLRAVRANLSPIYMLYRAPTGERRALIDALDGQAADEVGRDPDGDEHRLTVVHAPAMIERIGRLFAGRRLYVADGHHRYEAAVAYRDEQRARGTIEAPPGPDGPRAVEYVLALLVEADDPGVLILPTHRLVRGLSDFNAADVRARLARFFDLERLAAEELPGRITALTSEAGTICLLRFAGEADLWRLRALPQSPHLALMPADRGVEWRRLGAAIVGAAVLEGLLGIPTDRMPAQVAYSHDTAAALEAVTGGEAQMALLLGASTIGELMAVADAGEKMPPKSTYFSPKAPAGLVMHDLGAD